MPSRHLQYGRRQEMNSSNKTSRLNGMRGHREEAEITSSYMKAEVSWNLNWRWKRVWIKLIGIIKNADFIRQTWCDSWFSDYHLFIINKITSPLWALVSFSVKVGRIFSHRCPFTSMMSLSLPCSCLSCCNSSRWKHLSIETIYHQLPPISPSFCKTIFIWTLSIFASLSSLYSTSVNPTRLLPSLSCYWAATTGSGSRMQRSVTHSNLKSLSRSSSTLSPLPVPFWLPQDTVSPPSCQAVVSQLMLISSLLLGFDSGSGTPGILLSSALTFSQLPLLDMLPGV